MAILDRFSPKELRLVRDQLAEAEILLSHYYCIPGREWPRYPYDVKTLEDLKGAEIADDALAMVTRFQYCLESPPQQPRLREIFGICLQDHNILATLRRRPEAMTLEALMLYILTHELVHVFRFANFPQQYFIQRELHGEKEKRVHRIASGILRERRDPQIERVLGAYDDYLLEELER